MLLISFCAYVPKQAFLSLSVNSVRILINFYLPTLQLGKDSAMIHLDFKEMLLIAGVNNMAIEIHPISHHISFRFQKYQQQLQQRNSSHSSQFSPSSQPTDGPVTSSEQSPGDGGLGGSVAAGIGQTGAFLSSTPVKTFLLGSSSKVQYCMFFFSPEYYVNCGHTMNSTGYDEFNKLACS